MKRISYEILGEIPEKSKQEKYYYFYKIVNNINGKYYYGVHSTYNLNDGYSGSSKKLRKDIKTQGIEHFKKYILKFFNSTESMYEYENKIVTKKIVLEKNCYNMHTGGSGSWDFTIGRVCVKDFSGNTMMVDKTDEEYASGKLVSNMKGLIHVKTIDGENKTITKEEYYSNKNKYSPLISGYVLAKTKKDGKIEWFKKEDFDKLKKDGDAVGSTKNKGVFKNSLGEIFMCDVSDERVLSGEFVGVTKGVGVYKYREDFSKIVVTTKDDERVKNGELVGLNYGMIYCINPKTKETFNVKRGDDRLKNGEIITYTKYRILTGKQKGNNKTPLTIDDYRKKYPEIIDYIENGISTKEIAKKTGLTKKKITYLKGRLRMLTK